MTYPNGAQTVFQIICRGSVYSVDDGFFRNDGIGTDFETFDELKAIIEEMKAGRIEKVEIEREA